MDAGVFLRRLLNIPQIVVCLRVQRPAAAGNVFGNPAVHGLQDFRGGNGGLQDGAVVIKHRFSRARFQHVIHAVPAKRQRAIALHHLMIQPDLRRLRKDIAGVAEQMTHCPVDSHSFQRHPQHAGKHHRHQRLTLGSALAPQLADRLNAVHFAVRHVLPETLLGPLHLLLQR